MRACWRAHKSCASHDRVITFVYDPGTGEQDNIVFYIRIDIDIIRISRINPFLLLFLTKLNVSGCSVLTEFPTSQEYGILICESSLILRDYKSSLLLF